MAKMPFSIEKFHGIVEQVAKCVYDLYIKCTKVLTAPYCVKRAETIHTIVRQMTFALLLCGLFPAVKLY